MFPFLPSPLPPKSIQFHFEAPKPIRRDENVQTRKYSISRVVEGDQSKLRLKYLRTIHKIQQNQISSMFIFSNKGEGRKEDEDVDDESVGGRVEKRITLEYFKLRLHSFIPWNFLALYSDATLLLSAGNQLGRLVGSLASHFITLLILNFLCLTLECLWRFTPGSRFASEWNNWIVPLITLQATQLG